jgi:hypothetical protein
MTNPTDTEDGTMDSESSTISRRDLLKRGALVGGAVLWVAPFVQVVGMGRAFAKDVSPNCSRYCLKWNVDDNNETGELTCTDGGIHAHPVWSNNWEELGNGEGNSLTCPDDGVNDENAAHDITNRPGRAFVVYGSPSTGFWVAFPDDVKLADLEDESSPSSAAVKCGQGNKIFTASDLPLEDDPCITDPDGDPYKRIFIPSCGNGKDISHLELIIDWCP